MAKNLVQKATSDDRDAPQGFLLKELEDMTKSSIVECEAIEQALLSRLSKNSANVKWKCLKVIKHLSLHGNPNIAKAFQRKHENIRDCVRTQDPLYGDEMNERVRVAAKECIQVVFQAPTMSHSSGHNDLEHKIRGFEGNYAGGDKASTYKNTYSLPSSSGYPGYGNTSGYGNTRGYNGSGRSGMPGMGSSHVPQEEPGMFDKFKKSVGLGGDAKPETNFRPYEAPAPYEKPDLLNSYGGRFSDPRRPVPQYQAEIFTNQSNDNSTPPNPPPKPKPKARRKKGQVVGVFAEDEEEESNHGSAPRLNAPNSGFTSNQMFNSSSTTGNFGTTYPPAQSSSPNKGNKGRGTSAIEGTLVSDLCAAAGVKSMPPKDKLDKIVSAWSSLDQWYIAEQLDEKLDESEKWQVHKKALIVIETLAKVDDEVLSEYFREYSDNLVILATSSSQQSVSMKARRIIELFEIDADLPSNASSPTGYEQDDVQEVVEIPQRLPERVVSSPLIDTIPSNPRTAEVTGMFGNLNVSGNSQSSNTATPTSKNDDLLSFLTPTSANSGNSQKPSGFQFLQSLQANQNRPVELSFDYNPAPVPRPAVNLVDNPTGPSAFDFMGSSDQANPPMPNFVNPPMGMPMGMMMPNQGFNPYAQPSGFPQMGFAPPPQQFAAPFPFTTQQPYVTPDKNKKLDQQLGNIFN